MDKILELIAKYHNSEPEVFDDLGTVNRASKLLDRMLDASDELQNDRWGLGEFLSDLLREPSRADIEKLDGMLEIS